MSDYFVVFARVKSFGEQLPIFLLILAVVVGAIIIAFKRDKARRLRLETFAAGESLQYDRTRQNDMEERYPEFDLFTRGSSRYAENFITGMAGAYGLTAFDYRFTTGSGKNRTRHEYAVIILQPSFPLKPLKIRPEGIFDKVTAAFGWDDIDFESAEFSKRFHVSSQDRRWAFDVLTPRTIEFLMERGKPTLEMDHWRLMQVFSTELEPENIKEAIVTSTGLLDRIPAFTKDSL
jgi:hypothetical protein